MVHKNAAVTIEEENKNDWVVAIENKYGSYHPDRDKLELEKKSIYKWAKNFAIGSVMLKHRTPQVASFGPYHHGEKHLQPMEHHKERALYRILNRSKAPLFRFINSLEEVEIQLRDSYDDLDPKLTSDSFLRMMLLDGCFMLELLRYGAEESSFDPVFSRYGASTIIRRDMLLLENQIPLLVIRKLVEVEGGRDVNNDEFLKELLSKIYSVQISLHDEDLHILDIYRKCIIRQKEEGPPSAEGVIKSVCSPCQSRLPVPEEPAEGESRLPVAVKKLNHKLLDISTFISRLLHPERGRQNRRVRSAMRFRQAGVEFKVTEHNDGLKITFSKEKGVLTLPRILLEEYTAPTYMNMMAFERMHPELWGNRRVTSYVGFMINLIDTAEDVSLLCKRGIMGNYLGSDEEAAKVFNNLGIGIAYCLDFEVDQPLQKYVASGWNAAKAELERKYFHNPWSALSLLGAILFLVLTFIQTLFSVLAEKKGK